MLIVVYCAFFVVRDSLFADCFFDVVCGSLMCASCLLLVAHYCLLFVAC